MEVPTFISDTINNEFLPITHKLLTVPAQLIRMGSTGMNIEFIVGLNMVRDFISSSLFTPDGHKLWIHLPKAIATLVFASKERSKLVSLGCHLRLFQPCNSFTQPVRRGQKGKS